MSAHSVNADESNFEQVVLEGSKQAPVLVDFWAPWCAPCRALTPVMEKLAAEYQGKFVLAKINSDENQELAAQFGVRGIPSVKAFVDGKIKDEFSGALPEAAVRAFLEGVIPSPAEELRIQARETYAQNKDVQAALRLLDRAKSLDAKNEAVSMDRAEFLIDAGQHDEARAELDALHPLTQMEERVVALRAKLDLAAAAAAAPDAAALRSRIATDAGDLDARLQLANLLVAKQEYREALEQLLDIIRRNRGFRDDAARKTMLQVFSVLGTQEGNSELVAKYRKLLASAMY
jgi:putative thioredoxin